MRKISYSEALNEATAQEMRRDPTVITFGVGAPDHVRFFNSINGITEEFGPERCFDTPIAEDSMVGFAFGAALNGLRPIHLHIRVDFLLLAMNQLVNMISAATYNTGGKLKVPLVIRVVVGRGWGQGSQHSKSLHSFFAHIPGLKVIVPTTPYDAKGMLTAAIRDDNPVICMEHRWLYWAEDEVPKEPYEIPIGKANILLEGKDITIVATSWMNVEAKMAADVLARRGIDVEIVDPRTIAPLDEDTILKSVNKTSRCIVADNDWVYSGFGAEIAAMVSEKCFSILKSPVTRVGFEHTPCPTVRILEDQFYANAETIIRTVERTLDLPEMDLSGEDFYSHNRRFTGPF